MKISRNILATLFLASVLLSCGGSKENGNEAATESSNSEYYIEFGDDLAECNDLKKINYKSDGVKDITTFEIGSGILELNGFHEEWGNDPKSVEGKTYMAKISFSNMTEGQATISKVHEGVERSIGFDHKMEGNFESHAGKTGSFSVSVMFIP